jgi:hypothetical protein
MKDVTKSFSLFNFWVENIFLYLPLFVSIEILMLPLAYVKGAINIMIGTEKSI